MKKKLCIEEKMFNRVISGLHTSISSHISEFFPDEKTQEFYPNVDFYFEKVGKFQDRIENLYFSYSFLLR